MAVPFDDHWYVWVAAAGVHVPVEARSVEPTVAVPVMAGAVVERRAGVAVMVKASVSVTGSVQSFSRTETDALPSAAVVRSTSIVAVLRSAVTLCTVAVSAEPAAGLTVVRYSWLRPEPVMVRVRTPPLTTEDGVTAVTVSGSGA